MIIAGIFDPQGNHKNIFTSKLSKLVDAESKKSCINFENDFLSLTTGYFSKSNQATVLSSGNKIIVGTVFSKKSYSAMDKEDLSKINSSEEIIDNFWGTYIYISFDSNTKEVIIARDTVGQLPLFYHKLSDGAVIFSSKLSIIYEALEEQSTLNDDYLISFITLGTVLTRQTMFKNIFELFPGCQLHLKSTGIDERLLFNPAKYVSTKDSLQDIQNAIVPTLMNVLNAWTSKSDGILLDFSGGTDSSGILFCLQKLCRDDQTVKAINMYNSMVKSSDERLYARAIARESRANLIELDSMNSLSFDPVDKLPHKPNHPSTSFIAIKAEQDLVKMADEYKNPSFISGHGGDHIFLCPPPIQSLSDFLIKQGIIGFGRELKEMSMLYRRPLFPLLKDTISGFKTYHLQSMYKSSFIENAQHAKWLSGELFEQGKKIDLHPFYNYEITKELLPGKFKQIDIIYNGFATISDDVRALNGYRIFYPLFSQPMLELAFAIPTYKSYANGFNRYPFRRAISDYFKTNNIWRKDKGETSGVFQLGLKKNADMVMQLCLEGYCAEKKLVDRDLVYEHLTKVMNGNTDLQWPLTHLMTIEMHIKCWE